MAFRHAIVMNRSADVTGRLRSRDASRPQPCRPAPAVPTLRSRPVRCVRLAAGHASRPAPSTHPRRDTMIPRTRRLAAVATACTASLGLAACASSTGTTTGVVGSHGGTAVKGGTLNMLGAGDVDYMDPNISYYSVGYMRAAAVEPAAVHLPRRQGPDHQGRARPRHRDPDRGQRRHQRGRQDLHVHHPPGREVEHHPGPPGHRAGHGARRQAHLQPGPAVRRPPRLRRPDRRVTSRSATASPRSAKTPAAIAAYIDKTPLPGVVAKDDQTVGLHPHPPGDATSSTC